MNPRCTEGQRSKELDSGCQNQLIFCEKGGLPSVIRLSKYESNILINGFLANFQISIAKWSMHRHVADNGLKGKFHKIFYPYCFVTIFYMGLLWTC